MKRILQLSIFLITLYSAAQQSELATAFLNQANLALEQRDYDKAHFFIKESIAYNDNVLTDDMQYTQTLIAFEKSPDNPETVGFAKNLLEKFTKDDPRRKKIVEGLVNLELRKYEASLSPTQQKTTVDSGKTIPVSIIETVPIYPGCEGETNNTGRKNCLSEKINALIQQNFTTEIANDVGLSGIHIVYISFKINKKGVLENIGARAPHPRLEQEGVRVANLIPKMVPGTQRGQPVGVLYSLPITFKVED